jgi:hypothetical protein
LKIIVFVIYFYAGRSIRRSIMRTQKYGRYLIAFILLFALGCGGGMKTSDRGGPDTTPPDVVSVSSTGLFEVRVEFSEEVEATSAGNEANYDIPGLDIDSIVIDSSSKVAWLTCVTPQSYITYNVTISGIEDKNANIMGTPYQGTFEGSQDAPRVVNATTLSSAKVRVEFSEAVEEFTAQDISSYTFSPELGITSATRDPETLGDNHIVDVTLSEDMENTNYTVEVVNVTDLDFNDMDPYYNHASFSGDGRPKIERVNSTATDEIMIQFTEDVNIAEVDVSDAVYPYSGDHIRVENLDTPGFLDVTSVTLNTEDSSKLIVQLGSPQTTGERYRITLTGATTGVKDVNGNYVSDNTTGYFIGDGPLTIVTVEPMDPTTLVVTFSEEIRDDDSSNANTAAYFTIPGLREPVLAASWPYNSDKSKIQLTTPTQLQQIYTLKIVVGSNPPGYYFHSVDFVGPEPTPPAIDRDVLHEGYNTFSFQGDGLPTVLSAAAVDSNTVKVVFSETVELSSAQNTGNYSIISSGYPSLTIVGASRQPEPNSNEVVLTTSTQLYVNYTVTVTNVEDTTGNVISGNNTADFAGIGTDNTPPSILSVTAPSVSAVRIYFNEAVDETTAQTASNYSIVDLSSATITVTGQPVVDEYISINVGGTGFILLTAKTTEDTSLKHFSNAGSTQDIAYSIVKCINADQSSPVRAYVDGSDVELVSKTYGTEGDITVDDTNITNVSGVSVLSSSYTPTTATRSDGNSTQVDLTGFTVSNGLYRLEVVNVEDMATPANAIPALSPATAPVSVRSDTDTSAPLLMGAYADDSTHVKLLFDEPVDFLSANVSTNYAIEREIAEVTLNTGTSKNTPDTLDVYWDSNSINKNGDTTNASAVITMADTSGLSEGMNVFGDYIPSGATITSITPDTSITLDSAATGDSTGVLLTFIDMVSANVFSLTAAQNESVPAQEWAADNSAANSATSIANVLNLNSSSPVYAHSTGDTVYMACSISGSGTIDYVNSDTFSVTFTRVAADYSNNRTVVSSARNEAFQREVIITLDSATAFETGHDYGITATGVSDISVLNNKNFGGTRVVLPLGASSAPSGDTTPPEIVGAEAISDSLIRVIFSEPVEETGAENSANYTIVNPNLDVLGITSAVRDDTNYNMVLLYTEFQSPVTYTLTVNGIQDQNGNFATDETVTFSGMGAVSVESGPVGNTINGIGNLGNKSVTAMSVYNGKLYIATYNESGTIKMTEIHASDDSGVYFTQANNPGFSPPVDSTRQRTTTSFAVFDIDGDDDDDFLASTADAPADDAYIFKALNPDGIASLPHTWSVEKNMGNDSPNKLLVFGLDEATEHLYILTSGGLYYWDPDALPVPIYKNFSIPGFAPNCYVAFGGRMYVGGMNGSTIAVYRSTGVNAGFPLSGADFEIVLDATLGSDIGMDGYDDDDAVFDSDEHYEDSYNTNVSSITAFKGYVYIGTTNVYGAQVWRSQDGLTWERVLDFGYGADFNGKEDENNNTVTTMKVNGNYLYVGTENTATGAEVWRTPDGVSWNQFGSDGFGALDYVNVTSMESFLNLIYFGMDASTGGGAIFRSNN